MVPLDRHDVDTDQIIPQKFLKGTERTGYGDFLFYNWAHRDDDSLRPDFVVNEPERRAAKILVAGRNFGCGSSREHAVWAIRDWGFEAIVAPSFADIFRNNAINVGLLPVELAEKQIDELMAIARDHKAEVTIDLAGQQVIADSFLVLFEFDATAKERLLAGVDPIGATLLHEDALSGYESQRASWRPTTTIQ